MPDYKAPLRDIRFVRDELLGYEAVVTDWDLETYIDCLP